MAVTTSKYRSDNAQRFRDDVISNNYYVFASSTTRPSPINSEFSKQEFLEKTIFGKKVFDDNVFYMIKNYPWQKGQVYDEYDDTKDMSDKKYYAVVYPTNNETGDYRVYKCIFNNYGAEVSSPPNYNALTPDQIYEMSDGYKWKFLYAITETEFDKYNARGYVPIIDANTSSSDTSAEIDEIVITNPTTNSGYEEARGSISKVNTVDGSTEILELDLNDDNSDYSLSEVENYYQGSILYATSGNNSETYEIATYEYDSASNIGTVTLVGTHLTGSNPALSNSGSYKILPKIIIKGDGENAEAIPVIKDNKIVSVQIVNKGTGYTKAVAEVKDPAYYDPLSLNSLDIRADLRVVISPKGGHGTNLVEELSCRHILVHAGITNTDNESLPTTNNFASIGLVKDPSFRVSAPDVFDNRLIVSLEESDLSVGDVVIQIEAEDTDSDFYNERIFEATVHEIAANNTIYLTDYMGAFPPSTNTDIDDVSLRADLPIRSEENKIYTINTDNDPIYPSDLVPGGYAGYDVPDYIQRTGEVYFMDDIFPVERTDTSNEQFKIIFEF